PLQLTLAVRGDLRPRVSAGGRDVTFVNGSSAAVVNYHGLTVHDADGVALPAWFEASPAALVLSIDDRGARYPPDHRPGRPAGLPQGLEHREW
ncbi:MAG: hypothetical protein ACE5F9_12890, partial [Phycisphaerae bacterium]